MEFCPSDELPINGPMAQKVQEFLAVPGEFQVFSVALMHH